MEALEEQMKYFHLGGMTLASGPRIVSLRPCASCNPGLRFRCVPCLALRRRSVPPNSVTQAGNFCDNQAIEFQGSEQVLELLQL